MQKLSQKFDFTVELTSAGIEAVLIRKEDQKKKKFLIRLHDNVKAIESHFNSLTDVQCEELIKK